MIRALAGAVDRALNPVALKELRQAVRGRFVVAMLVLCFIAFLVSMSAFVVGQSINSMNVERVAAGSTAFVTLFMVLFTVCVFFIPLYSGLRMMAERSDTNIDLLFITSLRPRTIVLGKLQSAAALTGLIFCAAMPFFMFCYVLRGIDFVSILLLSGIGFFIIISESVLALFIGSLPASKPFKLLLAIVLFGVTLAMYTPMVMLTGEVMRGAGIGLISSPDFRRTALLLLAAIAMMDLLLLFASTAIITPPAANRALPIRTVLSAAWPLTLLIAAFAGFSMHSRMALNIWAVSAIAVMSLVLFSAVGEREAWGMRIARSIPRSAVLRRVAFAFYSGGGGVLFALGGMALTIAAFEAIAPRITSISVRTDPERMTRWLIEGSLCVIGYAFTALLVRRKLLGHRVAAKATWAIGLVLFIALAIVPPLLCLALDAERPDFTRWMQIATAANPFPITDPYAGRRDVRLAMLAIWCLVAAGANVPWLREIFTRFRNPADVEAT